MVFKDICAQSEMAEKSISWLIQIMNIKHIKWIDNITEGRQERERVGCNKEHFSSSSDPAVCKINHNICVKILLNNPSFCSGP